MSVRVYFPFTLERLAEVVEAGVAAESLERFVAADDSEESEYLALMSAADASTLMGATRRVVLVAQVEHEDAAAPRRTWTAVHVDADADHDPDDEPGWFGIQELAALLV
jgi:hypothetical protein